MEGTELSLFIDDVGLSTRDYCKEFVSVVLESVREADKISQ